MKFLVVYPMGTRKMRSLMGLKSLNESGVVRSVFS